MVYLDSSSPTYTAILVCQIYREWMCVHTHNLISQFFYDVRKCAPVLQISALQKNGAKY